MMSLPKFAAAFALALVVPAFAQAPVAERDPGRIAESVLGKLPGTVSVGVVRDGRVELVVRRRERVGQPMEAIDVARNPPPNPFSRSVR